MSMIRKTKPLNFCLFTLEALFVVTNGESKLPIACHEDVNSLLQVRAAVSTERSQSIENNDHNHDTMVDAESFTAFTSSMTTAELLRLPRLDDITSFLAQENTELEGTAVIRSGAPPPGGRRVPHVGHGIGMGCIKGYCEVGPTGILGGEFTIRHLAIKSKADLRKVGKRIQKDEERRYNKKKALEEMLVKCNETNYKKMDQKGREECDGHQKMAMKCKGGACSVESVDARKNASASKFNANNFVDFDGKKHQDENVDPEVESSTELEQEESRDAKLGLICGQDQYGGCHLGVVSSEDGNATEDPKDHTGSQDSISTDGTDEFDEEDAQLVCKGGQCRVGVDHPDINKRVGLKCRGRQCKVGVIHARNMNSTGVGAPAVTMDHILGDLNSKLVSHKSKKKHGLDGQVAVQDQTFEQSYDGVTSMTDADAASTLDSILVGIGNRKDVGKRAKAAKKKAIKRIRARAVKSKQATTQAQLANIRKNVAKEPKSKTVESILSDEFAEVKNVVGVDLSDTAEDNVEAETEVEDGGDLTGVQMATPKDPRTETDDAEVGTDPEAEGADSDLTDTVDLESSDSYAEPVKKPQSEHVGKVVISTASRSDPSSSSFAKPVAAALQTKSTARRAAQGRKVAALQTKSIAAKAAPAHKGKKIRKRKKASTAKKKAKAAKPKHLGLHCHGGDCELSFSEVDSNTVRLDDAPHVDAGEAEEDKDELSESDETDESDSDGESNDEADGGRQDDIGSGHKFGLHCHGGDCSVGFR